MRQIWTPLTFIDKLFGCTLPLRLVKENFSQKNWKTVHIFCQRPLITTRQNWTPLTSTDLIFGQTVPLRLIKVDFRPNKTKDIAYRHVFICDLLSASHGVKYISKRQFITTRQNLDPIDFHWLHFWMYSAFKTGKNRFQSKKQKSVHIFCKRPLIPMRQN